MGTKKKVDEILAGIESDRENGASHLAGRGLDALGAYAILLKDRGADESSVRDLVERIGNLRPSMGAIKTQAHLAFGRMNDLIKKGVSISKALETAVQEERKNLETADQAIADIALKEIGEGGIIVTCSSSNTVKRVVGSIKPALIRIGQGHPLNDGLKAAKWFFNEGFEVEIVPDGALPTAVEGARVVLIGADQVLADGSVVNRCSSLSLALSARHFGVPFFVVCQHIKSSGQHTVTIEEYEFDNGLKEGMSQSTPLFDVTPSKLIEKIITELGPMTAHQVGKLGQDSSY